MEATGGVYRGCIASKRRFFYGLRIHVIATAKGRPVEVVLAPGAEHDVKALKQFDFDLPEEAVVYGDKAYDDYDFEDLLEEAAEIDLLPLRKKNSKRAVPAYVEYLQHTYRKRIETAGSNIEKKLPASIHAVTAEGFELKVFLFVLALSFDGLIQHTTWVIIPRSEELPPTCIGAPQDAPYFLQRDCFRRNGCQRRMDPRVHKRILTGPVQCAPQSSARPPDQQCEGAACKPVHNRTDAKANAQGTSSIPATIEPRKPAITRYRRAWKTTPSSMAVKGHQTPQPPGRRSGRLQVPHAK